MNAQPHAQPRAHSERKTLGTAYNLRPSVEGVRAGDLRAGHVVMESHEHPAVVVRTALLNRGRTVRIWARYIWSAATEQDWELGTFHTDTRIPTATKGEY